jgi:4-hydroxy-3-polyprenylbenzoate decarboxylase
MMKNTASGTWVVGVTGASGIRYALRLIDVLADHSAALHVVFSESAHRVLAEEEGKPISGAGLNATALIGRDCPNVTFHNPRDIGAPIASGSFPADGMVIVPCSMSTVAALASGVQSHLVHRAAEVTMKEGRKLVIVPRETPLSAVHLENLAKLARIGVSVVPAMPGFYHRPDSVEALVDMMVMRILDQIGVRVDLVSRWKVAQGSR